MFVLIVHAGLFFAGFTPYALPTSCKISHYMQTKTRDKEGKVQAKTVAAGAEASTEAKPPSPEDVDAVQCLLLLSELPYS